MHFSRIWISTFHVTANILIFLTPPWFLVFISFYQQNDSTTFNGKGPQGTTSRSSLQLILLILVSLVHADPYTFAQQYKGMDFSAAKLCYVLKGSVTRVDPKGDSKGFTCTFRSSIGMQSVGDKLIRRPNQMFSGKSRTSVPVEFRFTFNRHDSSMMAGIKWQNALLVRFFRKSIIEVDRAFPDL